MKKSVRHGVTLIILVVCICIAFVFAINSGYSKIPYEDIFTALTGGSTSYYSLVLLEIRLPRIVLAVLCGMGLALSGCALQSITNNPLADPGILGINAGAGFAVLVFLSMFPSLHIHSMIFMPLFAFAGGFVVAAFLYFFAKRKGRLEGGYLLIGGIGCSAGFSALMLIMGANMENSSYQAVARWMAGNIWGSSWHHVLALLPYLSVMIPLLFLRSQTMDTLSLGRDAASSLGVRIKQEQRLILTLAVGLAASCISVCGGIGFIGLVSPHIARKLVGARHARLLPASMLVGALLLLIADTLGRSILGGIEIPAGIIVSILAAPYFLWLLRRF